MNFNLELLTTAEQCQQMLNAATKDKENLDFRKQILEYRMQNANEDAIEIAAELNVANQQLANFNQILPSVPIGDDRDELLDDIARLENEIIDLNARSNSNGFANVLNNEFNYQCIQRWRVRLDAFIAQVIERNTSLAT